MALVQMVKFTGKEEIECKAIADDAEAELNVALPALQKAMAEVEKLDKSAISEIKAYKSPPKQVETVLAAVMILFGNKTDWTTAKKVLGEANFLQSIKGYDKDNVSATIMKKLRGMFLMRTLSQKQWVQFPRLRGLFALGYTQSTSTPVLQKRSLQKGQD